MALYTRRLNRRNYKAALKRLFETTAKCAIALAMGAIPNAGVMALWWYVFHNHHIHVGKDTREVLLTSVIPSLFQMYALLITVLLAIVVGQYGTMRTAIKRYNLEDFMDFVDENLSPLFHGMASLLALIIIGQLMLIEHETFWDGLVTIGAVTQVFATLCIVVIEFDDPIHGFWVIRSFPEGWRDIDPKKWRAGRYRKVTVVEEVGAVEPRSTAPDPVPPGAQSIEIKESGRKVA